MKPLLRARLQGSNTLHVPHMNVAASEARHAVAILLAMFFRY